jgi:NAD-dependent dihydropyrimidine dehydrogenase PreA subunit
VVVAGDRGRRHPGRLTLGGCLQGMEGLAVTYVISEPCIDVKDRSCIEECPVDCIYEGDRMLYIHPDECVDCGACEPVCPVEAIFYDDDVPAQWKEFTAANAAFFTEGEEPLGSPGGAANVGAVLRDAEFVANYQVPET